MSDEIKQEPVDNPQPTKELSADELGEVTGGCFFSTVIATIVKPQVEAPPQQPQGGQNDPAQKFQQILQQLTAPQ